MYLNYFYKGLVSKYGHIRGRGFNLNFGETFSPYTLLFHLSLVFVLRFSCYYLYIQMRLQKVRGLLMSWEFVCVKAGNSIPMFQHFICLLFYHWLWPPWRVPMLPVVYATNLSLIWTSLCHLPPSSSQSIIIYQKFYLLNLSQSNPSFQIHYLP